MDRPLAPSFDPAPCRRRDGWTAERQRCFVAAIARGAGAREAAEAVGMSRQTAYALRSRPGGEGFARAWDEAAELAADAYRTTPPPTREAAAVASVQRLLAPRFYRGRLIGFVERDDTCDALRRLRQLDRMVAGKADKADRKEAPTSQPHRFPPAAARARG
ncbi:MAG: hypothetical protein AVDCRST_MAG31-2176 [uncultured Sphingomonas sp.]|uniref:Uncharacterized protein n=1 Tax=uncultured Sphingomonas sp. TaxID=158754 RepID=A0A6J4TR36_9SPHN|nr:hypothetical protein [uncultured Sphingomonas sp.]CAA9529261.1 MAG: hypothetical protein AVDCRST_MAG31-2176 [uncultured Sphingomonas sp.]